MKILSQTFAFIVVFTFTSSVSAAILSKDTTYYSDAFEGGSTSNGDIFSQSGFTAATCDVPLGKNIYVFSAGTGAIVRVNDRPNCGRYPNILDLTKKVFSLFAPVSAGRVSGVQINTLDSMDPSIFRPLGIELDTNTPTTYFAGDGVEFRGTVTNEKKSVIIFLQNEVTQEEITTVVPVTSGKNFRARFTLPKTAGKYALVVASGNSFKTQNIGYISLVSRDTLTVSDTIPEKMNHLTPRVEQLDSLSTISLGDGLWGNMRIIQDTKIFQTSGTRFLFDSLPQYRPGKANVKIDGYIIGTGGSLDKIARVPSIFSGTVILDRTHEKEGQNLATLRQYKQFTNLRFRVPATPKIRSTYYLTLPDGDVREFDFPVAFVGEDGYLISGKTISLSLPTLDEGTYLIEAVKADGIAYFNLPIIRGSVWNILEPYTSESASMAPKDVQSVTTFVVNRVNKIRAALGRNLLIVDGEYMKLAQAKAQDMVTRNYYGHQDPDGNYVNSLVTKFGLDIVGEFRENIAYGEGKIWDVALQDGLEESGSHRFAMLVPTYTKIGIGYVRNGDKTYMVEIIGE